MQNCGNKELGLALLATRISECLAAFSDVLPAPPRPPGLVGVLRAKCAELARAPGPLCQGLIPSKLDTYHAGPGLVSFALLSSICEDMPWFFLKHGDLHRRVVL